MHLARNTLGCTLMALCSAFAQTPYYNLWQTPSFYDQPYALSVFGSIPFVIARPLEGQMSIRTAEFPMGFRGLIADPLSDWLRNPAYNPQAASFELYGSGNDASTLFGGAIKQFGDNTVGVFVASSAATDRRLEGSSQELELFGQSSFTSSIDDNNNAIAAASLYRHPIGDGLALGVGYQYTHTQVEISSAARRVMFQPNDAETRASQARSRTRTHLATLGVVWNNGENTLAVRARGAISNSPLSENVSQRFSSTYSLSSLQSPHENDATINGVGVGVEYASALGNGWSTRLLAEVAYTTYDVPGKLLASSV